MRRYGFGVPSEGGIWIVLPAEATTVGRRHRAEWCRLEWRRYVSRFDAGRDRSCAGMPTTRSGWTCARWSMNSRMAMCWASTAIPRNDRGATAWWGDDRGERPRRCRGGRV